MKDIIVAVALCVGLLPSVAAQKRPVVKEVQVAPQASAREPQVLNLTKKGTIFSVPAGADYTRVVVRTRKGDMTVADLLKKTGRNITGPLRIGLTSDIRAQRAAAAHGAIGGGRRLNYDCGDLACACTGDDDCENLFTSGKCGPIAVCYPDGCVCIRI